jgi:ADP-heptose:LPS heptosyltransferase
MDKALFIQLSRMGDCLQSTPLLASWRKRFPDDRIVVLVRPENADIFERNPDVDETSIYNPPFSTLSDGAIDPVQRLAELQQWLSALKSSRFRSVVNMTHDELSCWITTALGPKETRGLYFGSSGRMRTRDPWGLYVFSLLKFRKANLFNIVDSYAHLSGSASVVSAPVFPLDPESVRLADDWLSPCAPGCSIIGFQPGASMAERRWPAENFIAIGRRLAAEGVRVLVFGSKAEESLGSEIAHNVPGAMSLAGKTTIPQLAALLARCAALVTNDTGTMHLGAAVCTRILALFESSAYFRETGPYGSGHWVIQSPQLLEYGQKSADELAGIRRIHPEEVLWAIHELLSETGENKWNRPAEAPSQLQALHFRSIWESGHLNFYPAKPTPLDGEIICNYLQQPVWLATLDGCELSEKETASGVFDLLRRYYIAPLDEDIRRIIAGLQEEVHGSLVELKQMKQLLQSGLEKLRRNPKHLVPQHQLAELTRLEGRILQRESLPSMNGFIGYFEIGLAMAGGNTTREYLEQYLIPVSLLERQLILFGRLLPTCLQFGMVAAESPPRENIL